MLTVSPHALIWPLTMTMTLHNMQHVQVDTIKALMKYHLIGPPISDTMPISNAIVAMAQCSILEGVHLEELDNIKPLCEGDAGALLDMKASTLIKGLDDQVMVDALSASLCKDIKLSLKTIDY